MDPFDEIREIKLQKELEKAQQEELQRRTLEAQRRFEDFTLPLLEKILTEFGERVYGSGSYRVTDVLVGGYLRDSKFTTGAVIGAVRQVTSDITFRSYDSHCYFIALRMNRDRYQETCIVGRCAVFSESRGRAGTSYYTHVTSEELVPIEELAIKKALMDAFRSA